VVSKKCLKLFVLPTARKTPFTLDEATSLSEQHLPLPEVIALCGRKVYHTGYQDVVIQASLFLTISKQGNAHTGWKERGTDHSNSLNVDKEINSLSYEKCTGLQFVVVQLVAVLCKFRHFLY
jgi:hypothetical protein